MTVVADIIQSQLFWRFLAAFLGCGWVSLTLSREGIRFPIIVLSLSAGIYAGLTGGRITFILLNNPYLMRLDPAFSLIFWRGCYHWAGVALLGGVVCFLVLRIAGGELSRASSAIAVALSVIHLLIQTGAFLRGDPDGMMMGVGFGTFWASMGISTHDILIYMIGLDMMILAVLWLMHQSIRFRKFALLSYWLMILLFIVPISVPERISENEGANGHFIVFARNRFASGVAEWKAFRERQGYTVQVHLFDTPPKADELTRLVIHTNKASPSYILLVGDCADETESTSEWHLPSLRTSGGKLSDMLFGDLNRDGIPDVPVGRFPVRSQNELALLIHKIQMYEREQLEKRHFRALVWTGAPGYNTGISKIMDDVVNYLPPWLSLFGLCSSPESVFSGSISEHPQLFFNQMAKPYFLAFAVVHGSEQGLVSAKYEGQPVFADLSDIDSIESVTPSAPLFILACRSGRFNLPSGKGMSFSEELIRHPGGPVSVVAASGDDGPTVNYLVSRAISSALKDGSAATIGELLLHCQKALHCKGNKDLQLSNDDMGGMSRILEDVSPDRRKLFMSSAYIREGSLRYNLLGDPSLSLRNPQLIDIHVKKSGDDLEIAGSAPAGVRYLLLDRIHFHRNRENREKSDEFGEKLRWLKAVNHEAEEVAIIKVTGRSWRIHLRESDNCRISECFLRFLLLGGQHVYYAIYPNQE